MQFPVQVVSCQEGISAPKLSGSDYGRGGSAPSRFGIGQKWCDFSFEMMLTLHSFFLSLLSFLLPVFCSSLSFLVKLEQLDLGGNDLEVLVGGEGAWVGTGAAPLPLCT